ncbi:MAG: hypothetical protein K9J06_03575 [Flavobacteriales bacterium]|nr:hypothetical protein [Flavobacteriales bacterium]
MTYLLKATVVAVAVLATTYLLGQFADSRLYHPHFPFVALFFLLGSWATHQGVIASLGENPKRFPAYFMGIMGIKMLVYLLGVTIYVFIRQEEAVPVVVLFLMFYVFFTALELVSLVPIVRRKNP